jgi:hypothetical protein
MPQATHRDILLTCDPLLLARFPWETWELRAGGGHRRIARVSNLIRAEVPRFPGPDAVRRGYWWCWGTMRASILRAIAKPSKP